MNTSKTAAQIVILAIVILLFFGEVQSFLIPIILGFVISLVLRPLYTSLTSFLRGRNRIAAVLCTLLLTLCVVVPLSLLTFMAVKEGAAVVKDLMKVSGENNQQVHTLMDIRVINNLFLAVSKIYPVTETQYLDTLKSVLKDAGVIGAGIIGKVAAGLPSKGLSLIFFLVAFYFGLVDGPKLAEFARGRSPFSSQNTDRLFEAIGHASNAVVMLAVLSAILHGVIIGSAYWILGLPKPLFFGAVTFILSFIPMIGSLPTGYGGAVFLLFAGRPGAAIVLLSASLLGTIAENVTRPWVLKGKTDLHPLVGLISALGGIELFGFSGVFLGPLIAALAIVLLEIMPEKKSVT